MQVYNRFDIPNNDLSFTPEFAEKQGRLAFRQDKSRRYNPYTDGVVNGVNLHVIWDNAYMDEFSKNPLNM